MPEGYSVMVSICGGGLQVFLWNTFTEGLDLAGIRQERMAQQNECGVLW